MSRAKGSETYPVVRDGLGPKWGYSRSSFPSSLGRMEKVIEAWTRNQASATATVEKWRWKYLSVRKVHPLSAQPLAKFQNNKRYIVIRQANSFTTSKAKAQGHLVGSSPIQAVYKYSSSTWVSEYSRPICNIRPGLYTISYTMQDSITEKPSINWLFLSPTSSGTKVNSSSSSPNFSWISLVSASNRFNRALKLSVSSKKFRFSKSRFAEVHWSFCSVLLSRTWSSTRFLLSAKNYSAFRVAILSRCSKNFLVQSLVSLQDAVFPGTGG